MGVRDGWGGTLSPVPQSKGPKVHRGWGSCVSLVDVSSSVEASKGVKEEGTPPLDWRSADFKGPTSFSPARDLDSTSVPTTLPPPPISDPTLLGVFFSVYSRSGSWLVRPSSILSLPLD